MDDTISRQAAIDEAEEWIDAVYCDHDEQRERDAIRHVINGIKELPSAQPYTDEEIQKMQELEQAELQKAYECGRASAQPEQDCILKQFGNCSYSETGCSDCAIKVKIRKALPSAQPEREKGEWSVEFSPAYKGGAYCECSQCNYKFAIGAYFEPDEWKFCPNCGADMRGDE